MAIKIVRRRKAKRVQKAPQQTTLLGHALRSLGTAGGAAIGGYFGNPAAGGAVGNSLGASISKWLGSGDYAVSSNSIVGQTLKSSDSIPNMHRDGQSVIIRHKEYLGEVTANKSFTINNTFPLNPGLAQTFPWLSGVANRFQEYRFKGVVYHYVPSSGSLSTGTSNALGTVMLQTTYRSNDAVPASKVEMLNEYWASESVPSEPFCHPIECDPKENPFNIQYVRTQSVPTGDNQLIYDLGATHLATSGQQVDGVVLGDLWITYEVELKKPVVTSNVSTDITYVEQAFTGASGSNWFATPGSSLGNLQLTYDGIRTLTFPKASVGTWILTFKFTASGTFSAFNATGVPTLANCSAFIVDPQTSATNEGMVIGGTSPTTSDGFYITAITITDPALRATVTMPSATVTGTVARGVLTVSRLT